MTTITNQHLIKNSLSEVPLWIKIWVSLSSLIVTWDFGYCLLRPHSMEGGSLNFLWKPYNLYGQIDHFYGLPAFNSHDGFTGAQAVMNAIETFLNFLYLWLLRKNVNVGQANLIGFSAALMTLSKTILYWLVEPFSGYQHIGHNTMKDLIFLWIIPNGFWIIVPSLVVYTLGKDIMYRLNNSQNLKQQ
ncbi:uncharacterized protein BX663DRAFT_524767 [Cokeromyces recurvatus]|uniref:uncharacterized protein n=1 Tax=Cokeromyces recurvatus TaxID=90255 RepID=UPI002220FFB0|nr:uncharacterized protein BX663DRAFT_524767 [Cokeromyces recurvatus]KAI7898452.1 hypothetical protein BX663DRAFT_524767 [Cokeromyces recurvatus]